MDIRSVVDIGFSGVVSVCKNGNNLIREAFGYADWPNKLPNRIDTRFPIASGSKTFVAVAVLRLIEEGRLSLSSRLGDLLTLDLNEIDPTITVEQLLTHMSGIPDYFDESIMDDYAALWQDVPNYRIRTSSDLLPLFIKKPMLFPPGSRYQYNNTGYVVLGLILEAVTGMPFDRYVDQVVFQPAGMSDTGYFELDRLPPNCAGAYYFDEGHQAYIANIYSVDVKGTGAGGAFTTVQDLDRFWNALMGNDLLPEETVQRMCRRQAGDGHESYGYGLYLDATGSSHDVFRMTGGDPGVNFISTFDPVLQLGITVVSNFQNDVDALHAKLCDWIRADPHTGPTASRSASP